MPRHQITVQISAATRRSSSVSKLMRTAPEIETMRPRQTADDKTGELEVITLPWLDRSGAPCPQTGLHPNRRGRRAESGSERNTGETRWNAAVPSPGLWRVYEEAVVPSAAGDAGVRAPSGAEAKR